MTRADRLDAELPQTQCTRCGYPTCRDYAVAMDRGEAALNRCPPGGTPTIRALAQVLGSAELPLDPDCGIEQAWPLAWIDPERCIGCTKCIQACPVDAILGTGKRMHTVVSAACTGCELCLPPCPVDCIEIRPGTGPVSPLPAHARSESQQARQRWNARLQRDTRREAVRREQMAHKREEWTREHAQELLAAALARSRARRSPTPPGAKS